MGETILDAPLEPDWVLGVVSDTETRDRGYIFLRDSDENEYFAHRAGFVSQAVFARLEQGDGVCFRYRQTSKGRRAALIREATVPEQVEIAEWEESRGNR